MISLQMECWSNTDTLYSLGVAESTATLSNLVERLALFQGADINRTDSEGRSPLILATASASWNIVNLLLSKGTDRKQADFLR